MDTHVTATHDLTLTRRIPAAPERVFAAWTDADQLKAWWGPRGMTNPEAVVEPRAGGRHYVLMRDPTGKEYPCDGVIEEFVPGRRITLGQGGGPFDGATVTITVEPDPVGTRLGVLWRHPTAEMREAHLAMGFVKGWGEMLDRLSAHAASPETLACPMAAPLSPDHGWLHRLLGDWTYESECTGPDGTPMRASGRESVRPLGGYWVMGEMDGTMPGGTTARCVVTMGFDTRSGRFRGSWIGSMMGHMFVYDGVLSEDGMTLSLDNEGPSLTGEGTARYRDVVELQDEDTRLLRSFAEAPDGSWTPLMSVTFRRAG
ncbi:MAG: DUF1579 family protein [Acetobacteraceae bacterium]|nr:DUF1579 family protein [Acetobacteraceae bacterium]